MSLVGGYNQPFPGSEALYSPYYAARFEPHSASGSSDAPYFTPWTFAATNQNSEMSPHSVEYSPPPYVPSPAQQTSTPTDSFSVSGSASGCDYMFGPCGVTSVGPDGKLTIPGRSGIKRRSTANKKERRRTLSINNAFADLRECIPNVPADTKLSKIKTLRLATSYIAYLMDLLAQDDPGRSPDGGFKAELTRKIESREEKRKTEIASLMSSSAMDKKSKGRTGWPQQMWALELKQDS